MTGSCMRLLLLATEQCLLTGAMKIVAEGEESVNYLTKPGFSIFYNTANH